MTLTPTATSLGDSPVTKGRSYGYLALLLGYSHGRGCGRGLWIGGGWVWAGIATFPILMVLDIALPPDHGIRDIRVPWLAEAPLYLHLPLLVALWTLFALRLGAWTGHTAAVLPGGVSHPGEIRWDGVVRGPDRRNTQRTNHT